MFYGNVGNVLGHIFVKHCNPLSLKTSRLAVPNLNLTYLYTSYILPYLFRSFSLVILVFHIYMCMTEIRIWLEHFVALSPTVCRLFSLEANKSTFPIENCYTNSTILYAHVTIFCNRYCGSLWNIIWVLLSIFKLCVKGIYVSTSCRNKTKWRV